MTTKEVTCSKCEESIFYNEDETPEAVAKRTGFTWGVYAESESVEPVEYNKITEDFIWLCPDCNSDKDNAEGC